LPLHPFFFFNPFILDAVLADSDACSLPTESPCVSAFVDYVHQEGLYYDETCIHGGHNCWSSIHPTDTEHQACKKCSFSADGDCPACVGEYHASWCSESTSQCCEDRCILLDSVALAARGVGLYTSDCTAGVDNECDATHDNCRMCVFDSELLEDWCPSGSDEEGCSTYTSLEECSSCLDDVYDQIWNKVTADEAWETSSSVTTSSDGADESSNHQCALPSHSRCIDIISEMDVREGLMLVHDSSCTFADPGCHAYTRNCRYCVADYNAILSAGHNSYMECPDCALDHYTTLITGDLPSPADSPPDDSPPAITSVEAAVSGSSTSKSSSLSTSSSSGSNSGTSSGSSWGGAFAGVVTAICLSVVFIIIAGLGAYFYVYRRAKSKHAYNLVGTKERDGVDQDDDIIEPLELETSNI